MLTTRLDLDPRDDAPAPAAVLAVDDEPGVLAAVSRLLRPSGLPVLTALGGEQAVAILEERGASIGVIISDYAMPGMNGAALLRIVRLRWPDIGRVLLTGNADLNSAADAVNEGQVARLFIKPWHPATFQQAVEQILQEHRLLRENRRLRSLVDRAATAWENGAPEQLRSPGGRPPAPSDGHTPSPTPPGTTTPLTPRERDVLHLLVQGRSNPEIADALVVSLGTVKIHVQRILSKFGVADRTQAAVHALTSGLVGTTR